MGWRARPLCMACQRVIHGPGTGVVGPRPVKRFQLTETGRALFNPDMANHLNTVPQCALCLEPASPFNIMRLWADDDEPDELGLGW